MFQSRDSGAEGGKEMGEVRKEDAPGGDKGKLDQSEGNGFRKGIED